MLPREEVNRSVSKLDRRSTVKSSFIKLGKYLKEYQYDSLYDFHNFEFMRIEEEFHSIGNGTFGEVFLAKNKIDGKYYAIKQLEKERVEENGGSRELIMREISIHRSLIHDNIVRLHSHHENETHFFLIMDYVNKGNLYQFIKSTNGLNEKEAFKYFIQVVNAVYFLHENNLVHRDLKPENLLLDNKGQIRLCDLGWCIELKFGNRLTFCGTFEYMAPEMIKELPYNNAVDVWSLGILLYELIHGYSPFKTDENYDTDDYAQIIKNILRYDLKIDNNVSPECKDLIIKLLTLDNKDRIKVKDVFYHPWVKSFEAEYKNEKVEIYKTLEGIPKLTNDEAKGRIHNSRNNHLNGLENKRNLEPTSKSDTENNKQINFEPAINLIDFQTFNCEDELNFDTNLDKVSTTKKKEVYRVVKSNTNIYNEIDKKNSNTNNCVDKTHTKIIKENNKDNFSSNINNISGKITKISNKDLLHNKSALHLSPIKHHSNDPDNSRRDSGMEKLCIEMNRECVDDLSMKKYTISFGNNKEDKEVYVITEEFDFEKAIKFNNKESDNMNKFSNFNNEYIETSYYYQGEKDSSLLNNFNLLVNNILDNGESRLSRCTNSTEKKEVRWNSVKSKKLSKEHIKTKMKNKDSNKAMNNNLGPKKMNELDYNTILSTETPISNRVDVSAYDTYLKQDPYSSLYSIELLDRAKYMKQKKLNKIHDYIGEKQELDFWDKISYMLNPFKCDK